MLTRRNFIRLMSAAIGSTFFGSKLAPQRARQDKEKEPEELISYSSAEDYIASCDLLQPDEMFLLGDDDIVLYTADGGYTWQKIPKRLFALALAGRSVKGPMTSEETFERLIGGIKNQWKTMARVCNGL